MLTHFLSFLHHYDCERFEFLRYAQNLHNISRSSTGKLQKVGNINATTESSRGQPQSNVQFELEGNILNNNITLTKNECPKYLSRDDMKRRIKAIRHTQRYINTVACVKLRSTATPASSYSNYIKCRGDTFSNRTATTSTTTAGAVAAAAITDDRLKIKTNLKSSPNSRKSIDKLYTIRSTSELNKQMHMKPDDSNIFLVDNSSSSTLILKRGKRTLSSTRLKRESVDNSIKLVKKHPTLRSLNNTIHLK